MPYSETQAEYLGQKDHYRPDGRWKFHTSWGIQDIAVKGH
jgi:hypothetical protein